MAPELRQTPNGASVCQLGVAVNSSYKDSSGQWLEKPNYFDVVVWGTQGENCAKYLSKGRQIAVDPHAITDDVYTGLKEKFNEEQVVLLIDEIDKADTDFQDDMLDVLDQMQFDIMEIDHTVTARIRPVVIITSNAKKDLSDPFLGRCNFHHIAFPPMEQCALFYGVLYCDKHMKSYDH